MLHGPSNPKGACLKPEFVRDIQLLGKLGITWDICMRSTELADAVKLVDACPEVRFILDHCGNGSARNPEQEQWQRDISELAKRGNVVCKISGITTSLELGWDAAKELEPVARHCIDRFGFGRAMFAGDWPVCNLKSSFAGWVACVKTLVQTATADEQRKLFHDNAAQFYRVG